MLRDFKLDPLIPTRRVEHLRSPDDPVPSQRVILRQSFAESPYPPRISALSSLRLSGAVAGESRNKLVNSDFFRLDIIQASCRQHPAF